MDHVKAPLAEPRRQKQCDRHIRHEGFKALDNQILPGVSFHSSLIRSKSRWKMILTSVLRPLPEMQTQASAPVRRLHSPQTVPSFPSRYDSSFSTHSTTLDPVRPIAMRCVFLPRSARQRDGLFHRRNRCGGCRRKSCCGRPAASAETCRHACPPFYILFPCRSCAMSI